MSTLNCIESYTLTNTECYGSFIIEPLEIGQGITLGNSLRRTLLSDLTSYAITGVRINDLKHEFSIIEGLKEDVLEILLNLKEIVFKNAFVIDESNIKSSFKGFLKVKGPIVVTAGLFNLPKEKLKIVNPDQYICTITEKIELFLEIDIENGKGYRLSQENRRQKFEYQFSSNQPSTLFVDALFMPVKKVNYKVKLINDSRGNIKESLFLEVITNGSITPKRSVKESLKILINIFSSLFITSNFLKKMSELNK
jgi:DNA-directed RNA polymerase subunit alpha